MSFGLVRAQLSALLTVLAYRVRNGNFSQLSPHERFILRGGDEFLHHNRSEVSTAVIGAFKGKSTSTWAESSRQVVALEPVPEFFALLQDRFRENPNIKLLNCALAAEAGEMSISLSGDKSAPAGLAEDASKLSSSEAMDARDFIEEYGPFSLMEINIEGGEYAVLERLLQTGAILKIETLLIQFHNIAPNSQFLVDRIRDELSLTHRLRWSYEWVWEEWVRKT